MATPERYNYHGKLEKNRTCAWEGCPEVIDGRRRAAKYCLRHKKEVERLQNEKYRAAKRKAAGKE